MNRQPNRRRVAIVLPDLRGGGVERMRLVLAREFLRRGIEVDFVLARARGELLADLPDGVRLFDLNADRMRSIFIPLRRYLRRERPDGVMAAMWPLTSIAILAGRSSGIGSRLLVSDHNPLSHAYGDRDGLHRRLMQMSIAATYPFAAARVAVSRGVAADLARLSGISQGAFSIIPNPAFAESASDAVETDVAIWRGGTGYRLLSVGSFKEQKNHALLIRAFGRVLQDCDATLLLLGEGPLRPQLVRLVQELGLESKVLLPGFRSNTASIYDSADLFVLSSDYEGFGNVIVEALSRGVPVVSTDCPSGPAEILDDGHFGELVPCGDEGALAAAMLRALEKDHDGDALRSRAAEFSPERAASAYLSMLFDGETFVDPAH